MSRTHIALLALVLLAACQDEEQPLDVTFWAQCQGCEISYGRNGEILATDSIGGPVVQRTVPAFVDDEVFLKARPLVISSGATGIAILIRGRQQDFQFVRPNTPEDLATELEIRLTVPDLDRFGEPK